MGSLSIENKPHALCIPYPAQGHISPMLKLAKLLHFHGFHITFVNTEFNHQRLMKSRGSDFINGNHDFRFETIPDGLPPSDPNVTQDIPSLCDSVRKNCLIPFRNLINKLNDSGDVPNVSCIVSDGVMSFTLKAAAELGIPVVVFFTISACGFLCYASYTELIERGYVPFKDENCFTNGYLNTRIDWIPGMEGVQLRDFPSFIRTTDRNSIMLNYDEEQSRNALKAQAVILNTFEDLEPNVLATIRAKYPRVFTLGPLQLLERQIPKTGLESIGSSLWKEEPGCLEWLNKKEARSVVYVNFGSITVMSTKHLVEMAWGLANCKYDFLWIIRPDMVSGDSAVLPEEFIKEIEGRGLLAGWCPQEEVLKHPAVAVFITHCGWNSTLESISEGVPMICWPFFAEQPMNCRFVCTEWAVGMEIDADVKREKVEEVVREMMEGKKGKEMRSKALEWKVKAQLSVVKGGSSYMNLESLIKDVLLPCEK